MELRQGTNRVAQLLGLTATVAQGLVDASPARGGSAGAGRGYWWRTGPGLRHCSRLEVEAGDGNVNEYEAPLPFI